MAAQDEIGGAMFKFQEIIMPLTTQVQVNLWSTLKQVADYNIAATKSLGPFTKLDTY